jgi:hypothetical protein
VDYVESYTMFVEYFDSCIVICFGGSPSEEVAKTKFV